MKPKKTIFQLQEDIKRGAWFKSSKEKEIAALQRYIADASEIKNALLSIFLDMLPSTYVNMLGISTDMASISILEISRNILILLGSLNKSLSKIAQ